MSALIDLLKLDMWVLITLEFSPMLYDNMGLLHTRIVGVLLSHDHVRVMVVVILVTALLVNIVMLMPMLMLIMEMVTIMAQAMAIVSVMGNGDGDDHGDGDGDDGDCVGNADYDDGGHGDRHIVMQAKINSNQKKSDKIVSKSAPGPIRGLSAILRLISPT